MKLKKISIACCFMVGSYSGLALAEGPISGNVALTSDYVWRGTSQTDNGPAIQGGFDYAHASGFYVGVWGSNVDFKSDANVELDLYGGYSTELGNGLGVDVGVIHYDYPSESNLNFEEVYLGLSYDFLSAKVSHDPDNDNTYWEAGADFALPQDFSLGLHVGYTDPDAGNEVTDWKVAVGKSAFGVDFELAYTDTDSDNNSLADGRGIFTVSKSF
ncbi:TorF family putative porin [Sedimenticola hydrogenitrophicus]|uniref:TorF family putative porin n=1 Tax=Sedimenticola hydrogenitrophicus TaxID=2967975 RepID=UPI0023B12282|nr:TorF family putative porin [Sedimenticola hydrogenitrophicus]